MAASKNNITVSGENSNICIAGNITINNYGEGHGKNWMI